MLSRASSVLRQVVVPFGLAVVLITSITTPAAAYGDREDEGGPSGRFRGYASSRSHTEEDEDGPPSRGDAREWRNRGAHGEREPDERQWRARWDNDGPQRGGRAAARGRGVGTEGYDDDEQGVPGCRQCEEAAARRHSGSHGAWRTPAARSHEEGPEREGPERGERGEHGGRYSSARSHGESERYGSPRRSSARHEQEDPDGGSELSRGVWRHGERAERTQRTTRAEHAEHASFRGGDDDDGDRDPRGHGERY